MNKFEKAISSVVLGGMFLSAGTAACGEVTATYPYPKIEDQKSFKFGNTICLPTEVKTVNMGVDTGPELTNYKGNRVSIFRNSDNANQFYTVANKLIHLQELNPNTSEQQWSVEVGSNKEARVIFHALTNVSPAILKLAFPAEECIKKMSGTELMITMYPTGRQKDRQGNIVEASSGQSNMAERKIRNEVVQATITGVALMAFASTVKTS